MNKLIIANWKMQYTHEEAISWLTDHSKDLELSLAQTQNKLVICPSFTELPFLSSRAMTHIAYGAQDCGVHQRGPCTGDVSVLSLKELGCSYCLVGHSERRRYYNEINAMIVQKVELLIRHGIEPIVCIGENAQERDNGLTLQILEKQLMPLVELAKRNGYRQLTIAYEPVWSIGTQQVPRAQRDYGNFFGGFKHLWVKLDGAIAKLLYGGSVNERTIVDLGLSAADGFLLGKSGS